MAFQAAAVQRPSPDASKAGRPVEFLGTSYARNLLGTAEILKRTGL
jgi:hypothetical protein